MEEVFNCDECNNQAVIQAGENRLCEKCFQKRLKKAKYETDKHFLERVPLLLSNDEKDKRTAILLGGVSSSNYEKLKKEKGMTYEQKQYYNQFIDDEEEEEKTALKDFELIWDGELEDFQENKDWIIDKLIPQKSVGIWTGKRSTFKTFLVLNAVYCIAAGIPFLNYQTKQGTVIYLDKENGLYTMRDRTRLVKEGLQIQENQQIGFICFSTLKIDKLRDIKKISEVIEEHKPSLLVVDTYRRGISFEENDAGEVSKLFVDILRPLVEKYDLSIVLIHHDRKGGGQGDEMDEIRGSSDLANYVDFILKNERKGERIILKQLKNRSAPEIKPIDIQIESNNDTYIAFKNMGEHEIQTKEEKCAEQILLWITKEDLEQFKTSQVKELAFQKGFKKNNFFSALQNLCDRGLIEKGGRGEYRVLKQRKLG